MSITENKYAPYKLEGLERLIREALAANIKEETERIVKEAVQEFEAAVRAQVGRVVLDLLSVYNVQRVGKSMSRMWVKAVDNYFSLVYCVFPKEGTQ